MQLHLLPAEDRPADHTDQLWIDDSGRPVDPQIVKRRINSVKEPGAA
jgi:hypothetical protein